MFVVEAKGTPRTRGLKAGKKRAGWTEVSGTFATPEAAEQFAQIYRAANPECEVRVERAHSDKA